MDLTPTIVQPIGVTCGLETNNLLTLVASLYESNCFLQILSECDIVTTNKVEPKKKKSKHHNLWMDIVDMYWVSCWCRYVGHLVMGLHSMVFRGMVKFMCISRDGLCVFLGYLGLCNYIWSGGGWVFVGGHSCPMDSFVLDGLSQHPFI